MKVSLIKRRTIENYVRDNARSRSSFKIWLAHLKFADWNLPNDILKTYGAADLLGNGSNRVVFDIGGNNFRMICKYLFGEKNVRLYIKWIGNHSEFTELLRRHEQYTTDIY